MAIYSTRFAAVLVPASSNQVLYTVPSGNLVVVRCIDCVVANPGSASAVQLLIAGKGYIFSGSFTTTVGYLHWDGRQVLNATEQLSCLTTTQGCYVCVSGYLLEI